MSRKLLMNNFSKDKLPVKEGLVCWLDGWDENVEGNIWKDRSGNNNNGILYNFSSPIFENGYLVAKDSRNYIEIFKNFLIQDTTLIINIKLDSSNKDNILMGLWDWGSGKDLFAVINRYPSQNSCSLIWSKRGSTASTLTSMNFPSEYVNITISISDNTVKTFLNSNLIGTKTFTQELILERFCLFRKGDALNNCCKGKVGSFMAYNRTLSEQEIEKIYLYEQSVKRG